MLKPHLNHHHHQTSGSPIITRAKKAFITGDGSGSDASVNPTSFLSHNTLAFPVKRHVPFCSKRNSKNSVGQIKAVAGEFSTADVVKTVSVKAVITVQMTVGGVIENLSFTRPLDDITDLLGKSLLLELVAAETDPRNARVLWDRNEVGFTLASLPLPSPVINAFLARAIIGEPRHMMEKMTSKDKGVVIKEIMDHNVSDAIGKEFDGEIGDN
nr:linoleate 13S-lipoxygenase 2-1, chloroplastic-like [Tanacetum cinerariifolium]